jgi:hypothetical protein
MTIDLQLITLLLAGLVVFGIHFRRRAQVRVGDPAFLVFCMFLLGTVLKLVYFLFFRVKNYPQAMHVFHDPVIMGKDEGFLVMGMLFIVLSMAVYCLGLWHPYGIALRPIDLRPDERFLRSLAILACLATLVGLALLLHRSGAFVSGEIFEKRFNDIPGGATNRFFVLDYWIFKACSSIKYLFYALLIYWLRNEGRTSRMIYLLLGATLVLSVLAPSVVGNRSHSMVVFLDLVLVLALGFSRRRLAVIALLITISAAFLGTTSVARILRPPDPGTRQVNAERWIEQQKAAASTANQRGGYRRLDKARVARSQWLMRLVGRKIAKRIDVQMQGRYFLDLYKTAHIVDDVPERIPFLRGESFVGWVFVLVPKSVWADKPMFGELPSMLAEEIFLEPTNNIPPGFVGEAWLNFGWLGLVVVGLVGGLMGVAYNSFRSQSTSALVAVFYAMLVSRMSFILFNTSFGDATLKFALDAVPVFLLLLLASGVSVLRERWRSEVGRGRG